MQNEWLVDANSGEHGKVEGVRVCYTPSLFAGDFAGVRCCDFAGVRYCARSGVGVTS